MGVSNMKGLYHWIQGKNYGKYWTDEMIRGGNASILNYSVFRNISDNYNLLFLKEGFSQYNSNIGQSAGSVYQMLLTFTGGNQIIWVNPAWITPMRK
jgi:hypothetical protein